MTDKENKVARYELDLRRAESRVREGKVAMTEGYKKLQAEMERDYAKLKGEYERELLSLEHARVDLELAKSELAQGFDH